MRAGTVNERDLCGESFEHTGARNVTVSLDAGGDGTTTLRVVDDGAGMRGPLRRAQGPHYGLVGMRERAAMIGAELQVVSTPGKGTSVVVQLQERAPASPGGGV